MSPRALFGALILWGTVSVAPSFAAVNVTFQDGVSPPGYAGTQDVYLDDGSDFCWDPATPCTATEARGTGNIWDEGTLMRWDLTALAPGTPIQSAELVLSISNPTSQSFPVYECLRPWVGGEATWNEYRLGQPWSVVGAQGAGSDRGATAVATITGLSSWRTFSLSATLVQQWVNTPATNHGLVVQNYAATDAIRWDSVHILAQSLRPILRLVHGNGKGTVLELQQGRNGYAGMTDATLGIGPDPKTWNFATRALQLDGHPYDSTGLLRFDLSSLPPWATVISASLELFAENGSAHEYGVYEALQPWTETGATWMSYDGTNPWSLPGATGPADRGARLATIAGGTAHGAAFSVPLEPAGVQRVQDWIRGVAVNHGFLLQNHDAMDGLDIAAHHDSTAAQRPALSISWVEGQLQVVGPVSGAPAQPLGPFTVSRAQTDGPAIAAGAPSLTVEVTAAEAQGELSPSPSGPWASSVQLTIGAGTSESEGFFYRQPVEGITALTADGGAAWQALPFSVVVSAEPDAGIDADAGLEPDAGMEADAGSAFDGGPAPEVDGGEAASDAGAEPPALTALNVGCGCQPGAGGPGPVGALLLGMVGLMSARRRRG